MRIEKLTQMAPRVTCAADIGSDHGKLTILLIKSGKAERAIAADISRQSLIKARRNIAHAGLEELIDMRVGDGLSVLKNGECQLICVCGMGGELISRILLKDIGKLKGARLLLCPHNAPWELRNTLNANGFRIADECVVAENGRFYQLMLAEEGFEPPFSDVEAEFGRINISRGGIEQLIKKRMSDMEKTITVAQKSDSEKAARALQDAQRKLKEMRKL